MTTPKLIQKSDHKSDHKSSNQNKTVWIPHRVGLWWNCESWEARCASPTSLPWIQHLKRSWRSWMWPLRSSSNPPFMKTCFISIYDSWCIYNPMCIYVICSLFLCLMMFLSLLIFLGPYVWHVSHLHHRRSLWIRVDVLLARFWSPTI